MARLVALMPGLIWQPRNQRRMHLWRGKGDAPYRDTEDSMRQWLETPTAVAARLTNEGRIELLAPYGSPQSRLQGTPPPGLLANRPSAAPVGEYAWF